MNKQRLLDKFRAISVEGKPLRQIYEEISSACMEEIRPDWGRRTRRTACYFSMEYLVGRAFYNNLMELGVLPEAEEIFAKKGFALSRFEEIEDAALGNGGLGRLAACYLDSAAARGLPLQGYGLRYRYGLFRQRFVAGEQVEEPEDWLAREDPWSVRREREKRRVTFADMTVVAVPYDMPVFGKTVNTLRLFQAEGSPEAEQISGFLYPPDDTDEGKLLRIRQEYFFSAAAIGEIVDKFIAVHGMHFERFPEFYALQLNDTHATFAVAEFLRILNRVHRVPLPEALEIARKTFHYTNHTVLAEALECWKEELVAQILPDIALILKQLHVFSLREWQKLGCTAEERQSMALLTDGYFSMANAAVYVARRVNGVAEMHTGILKEKLFRTAFKYYPNKFTNITNGVSQRRWLMLCNRELSALYDSRIGTGWRDDLGAIARIPADEAALSAFRAVKAEKKRQLREYIRKREGVTLLDDALYAAQTKRLHEYKRQFMTALAVLYLRFELKEGKREDFAPMVFLFGGKAAAGYRRAKEVIRFVNAVAELVAADEEVSQKLQVVFVQNYDVSYAEKIVAGTDVSLQVSAAGFEASGTGNMKFMMNGAVTVGTMDGANIEIAERAGGYNNYMFGVTAEEAELLRESYDPAAFAESNEKILRVVRMLTDGSLPGKPFEELYRATFTETYNSPDFYLCLYDLESYVDALLKVNADSRDEASFSRKQFENAIHSSFFSSDRAIEAYARKIWKLEQT